MLLSLKGMETSVGVVGEELEAPLEEDDAEELDFDIATLELPLVLAMLLVEATSIPVLGSTFSLLASDEQTEAAVVMAIEAPG